MFCEKWVNGYLHGLPERSLEDAFSAVDLDSDVCIVSDGQRRKVIDENPPMKEKEVDMKVDMKVGSGKWEEGGEGEGWTYIILHPRLCCAERDDAHNVPHRGCYRYARPAVSKAANDDKHGDAGDGDAR